MRSFWLGVVLAALVLILGYAYNASHPTTRNVQIAVYDQIVRESGLKVEQICGYRGGPITTLVLTGDYSGLLTYSATCGDGSTSQFDVEN